MYIFVVQMMVLIYEDSWRVLLRDRVESVTDDDIQKHLEIDPVIQQTTETRFVQRFKIKTFLSKNKI